MAKKQKNTEAVETPKVVEQPKVETPVETAVVEKPKKQRKEPTYKKAEDGWEIKDRMYYLKGDKKPL